MPSSSLGAMYSTIVCILSLLLLSVSAQRELTSVARIYTSQAGNTALAIEPQLSNSVCSSTFFLLSNSATQCFTSIDTNGTVYSSNCPSDLLGATMISCTPSLCFALVPGTPNKITAFFNATVWSTFGTTELTNPTAIHAVRRNTTHLQVMVTDYAGTNTVVYAYMVRIVSGTTIQAAPQVITTLTATNRPTGIVTRASGLTFLLSFANTISITQYNVTSGASIGLFGTAVSNVQKLATDFNGRVFAYDTSCNCIKIFTAAGAYAWVVNNINNNPTSVSASRNHIFVVDSIGVLQIGDPLQAVSSYTDISCPSRGGTAYAIATGGAFPVTFKLYPDQRSQAVTVADSTSNYTFTGLKTLPAKYPYVIFNDSISLESIWIGGAARTLLWDAQRQSTILGVTFTSGSMVGISCGNCINTQWYSKLDFWINVGAGGQTVNVIVQSTVVKTLRASDYQNNTWYKISIDIQDFPSSQISSFYFQEAASVNNVNQFYFEDIYAVPHNLSSRRLAVTDSCGAVKLFDFDPVEVNLMSVSIATTPTSCNAAGNSSAKARDATASAVVKNAVGALTYQWTLANSTAPSVTGLPQLRSNSIVYDNALNSSWFDWSTTTPIRNPQDTTMFYSAPYSYSFVPTDADVGISFISPSLITSDRYSRIEWWLYGGAGGQKVNFQVARYTSIVQNVGIYTWLNGGLSGIPAYQWVKGVYTLSGPITTISILANGVYPGQDRIYIDDLVLVSKDIVTVTDSTGCVASTPDLIISSPPTLIASPVVTNAKCYNTADGSFFLNVAGGTAPYSPTWSNAKKTRSGFTDSVTDLSESQLLVNVTDSLGCAVSPITLNILQPPQLTINVKTTEIRCAGEEGEIEVYASGGTGPFTYSWSSDSGKMHLEPHAAPVSVYSDVFAPAFSLLRPGNTSSVCLGTGSITQSSFSPSHSGYCSISPVFSDTFPNITIGSCSSCLQPSLNSGLNFWIYIARAADADNLKISMATGDQLLSTPDSLSSLNSNLTFPAWNQIFLSFDAINHTSPDSIVIIASTPSNVGTIFIDDIVVMPKAATSVGFSALPGFKSRVVGVAGTYFLTLVDANGCAVVQQITLPDGNDDCVAMSKYDRNLSAGLGAFIGVGVLLCLFALFMLTMFSGSFTAHGIFYTGVLLAGVALAYASALTLVPRPTDTLCVAFPWLLGVGFVLVYGCLFIKTWALYRVWLKATQFQRATMTPYYIIKVVGFFLSLEIIFLIIWTVVDPPRVKHVKMVDDTIAPTCESDTPAFWIIFLSVKGLWLLFGAVLSVLTRHIMKEYNESASIAYAIYNNVILLVIAVPLAVLLREVPGGRLVIEVAIIWLAFTFTMCIMFYKNWHRVLVPTIRISAGSAGKSGEATTAARSNNSSRSHTSSRNDSQNSSNSSGSPPHSKTEVPLDSKNVQVVAL